MEQMSWHKVLTEHEMTIEADDVKEDAVPMFDVDGDFVCWVPLNTTPEALNAMLQLANKRWHAGRHSGYREAQKQMRQIMGIDG